MGNLFAKKQNVEPVNVPKAEAWFELFTTEVVKDVRGKEVTIPRSIGFYNLSGLKQQKKELNDRIAEIDEKIAQINVAASEV